MDDGDDLDWSIKNESNFEDFNRNWRWSVRSHDANPTSGQHQRLVRVIILNFESKQVWSKKKSQAQNFFL